MKTMNKIKTLNDLRRMRETMQASLDLREKSNAPEQPVQEADSISCPTAQGGVYEILVCGGTGCRASQSQQIIENLETAIEKAGLQDKAKVIRTGCFGFSDTETGYCLRGSGSSGRCFRECPFCIMFYKP